MATLEDIFPGSRGQVLLTRIAHRLRRPELLTMPRNEPLSEDLERQLRNVIAMVQTTSGATFKSGGG